MRICFFAFGAHLSSGVWGFVLGSLDRRCWCLRTVLLTAVCGLRKSSICLDLRVGLFYHFIPSRPDCIFYRISIGIMMSFTARGLSSINGNLFCYTAITSSSIIGILPGYLICAVVLFLRFGPDTDVSNSEQLFRTGIEKHRLGAQRHDVIIVPG